MESKLRVNLTLQCKQCGANFDAKRRDAEHCCNACRQQAYLSRAAPKFVSKSLPYIEDDIRRMEYMRSYRTKENIDYVLERIRDLVNGWYYRRLPYDHQLRDYVEGELVRKLDVLIRNLQKNSHR